jgi:hypothetical protein
LANQEEVSLDKTRRARQARKDKLDGYFIAKTVNSQQNPSFKTRILGPICYLFKVLRKKFPELMVSLKTQNRWSLLKDDSLADHLT